MWDLQTLIALNRLRQEEYDKAHPREAERRRRADSDAGTVPAPYRPSGAEPPSEVPATGNGTPPAPYEGSAPGQPELAGPLARTLSLYLQ
jgi:hypothetical protein